jgi:hypothetical protein
MEQALRIEAPAGTRDQPGGPARRPPAWLMVATAALTFSCLAMAVAETTLWMHYLIDEGEYVSIAGLAFILVSGVYLFRKRQLLVSLPLVLPWLLYPVITQGDQLIDNLTINEMRVVCHVLLALLFGAPVAVVVLVARYALAPEAARGRPSASWTRLFPGLRPLAEGQPREGSGLLAAALFVAEIWIARQFLGALMVGTLIAMAVGALVYAWLPYPAPRVRRAARGEGFALAVLLTGVTLSFGLYVGYKNRPGAYQGSPAFFMDPTQSDAEYPLHRISAPSAAPAMPSAPISAAAHEALTGYARALQQLVDGYYIADRNYNYAFHNALFLRSTPVLPEFRNVALRTIAGAARTAAAADSLEARLEPALPSTGSVGALLADARAYVAFNFRRAAILERKTAGFETTEAGLQHATHIYEGEAKIVGIRLMDIIHKHGAVTTPPGFKPITGDFVTIGGMVYNKYSNRIVGF